MDQGKVEEWERRAVDMVERHWKWFVVAAFVCNGLAFMLALSKNAILSVGLVALVYTLVMAFRFKQRKPLFWLIGFIALVPVGLILLYLVSGISFTDMIEARAQDSGEAAGHIGNRDVEFT